MTPRVFIKNYKEDDIAMAKSKKKKNPQNGNTNKKIDLLEDFIDAFPSDVKTVEELRKKAMTICSMYCDKNRTAPPNISREDFADNIEKLIKTWEKRYSQDKVSFVEHVNDPNANNIIDEKGYLIFNKKFINSTNSDYCVRIKIRLSFDGYFEPDHSRREVAFFSIKVQVHISNMLEKFKEVAKMTKSNLSYQVYPYLGKHSFRVSGISRKVE